MPRSRGFCPAPVVKPSCQFFSLSSKATNSVASVVFSYPLYVDGVVMSFLLHNRFQGMEKSLPTTVRRRNQWTSIVSPRLRDRPLRPCHGRTPRRRHPPPRPDDT